MLMRTDPFRDFDRLTQQLCLAPRRGRATMPLDAYRLGDGGFLVQLDLPGGSTPARSN